MAQITQSSCDPQLSTTLGQLNFLAWYDRVFNYCTTVVPYGNAGPYFYTIELALSNQFTDNSELSFY
ncbi:MAG: hypothetical protein LVQ75_05595 [Candidatus Babeliales bacterium]